MICLTQAQWTKFVTNYQKVKKELVFQMSKNELNVKLNRKYAIYVNLWEFLKQGSMRVRDI